MTASVSPSRAPQTTRFRLSRLLLAMGLSCSGAGLAADLPGTALQASRDFHIQAGPLGQALNRFAEQSDTVLVYDAALAADLRAPALDARLPAEEALRRLLAGTGLDYRIGPNGAVDIRRGAAPAAMAQAPSTKAAGPAQRAVAAPGTTDFATVQVTAESANATTEKSGSYTTRALTLGKSEYSLREIPQSVSVITRQRMDDQNMVTVKDALAQTTGITVQANDNPYLNDAYYARGYALAAELDGIPSSGSLNVGTPQFDLAMYDRIEVIRGSAGLLEGSGEPGGLVNFARKRPTADAQVSGSLSVGSWDHFHGDFDASGPLTADKSLQGRLVVADTDSGEFYDHSHRQSQMLYGILEYHLGASTLLSLSATVQHDQTHGILSSLPAYATGVLLDVPRSTNPFPDWTRSNQDTREAFAELDHFFGNGWRMRVSTRYRDTDTDARYVGIDGDVDPATDLVSYFPAGDKTRFQWLAADANASGPFELFGRTHQLLVGVNYDEAKTRDEYSSLPDGTADFFQLAQLPQPAIPLTGNYQTRLEQYGAYAQARFSLLDPLTFIVGGRVSSVHTYSGNTNDGSSPRLARDPGGVDHKVTPYAALIYDVSREVSLYASYAQIFVPQTELTASGSPLPPRTGDQYELGAKGAFMDGRLNASAALFSLKDRNRAYYSSDVFYFSAAGEVRMQGAEAEVAGSPLPGLDLSLGYTYLDPHYRTAQDAANLATITRRHNAKLWGNYHFQHGMLEGFSVGAGLLASSGWDSSTWAGRDVRLPGYAVASLQVGYRLDPRWSMTLTFDNLFDRSYFQTFNTNGLYGEPRSVMLTLRGKY